jgi:hypothetical protein
VTADGFPISTVICVPAKGMAVAARVPEASPATLTGMDHLRSLGLRFGPGPLGQRTFTAVLGRG